MTTQTQENEITSHCSKHRISKIYIIESLKCSGSGSEKWNYKVDEILFQKLQILRFSPQL